MSDKPSGGAPPSNKTSSHKTQGQSQQIRSSFSSRKGADENIQRLHPSAQHKLNEHEEAIIKNKIEKYIAIGDDAAESKEYDEALFHYENALRLCKEIPENDKNTETIANINFKLGTTSKKLEYYVQAEEYLHTAISGFVGLHGKNYFESARSYSQLGDVYYYVNDYKNAIINHSEALKSYTNIYGEEVPLVAWSHYDLGLDYYWIKDYEQSTDHFFKAVSIRITLYGINHDEVANCYNRLGLSFYWADKYEKSIKYYNYALEIWEHLHGRESEKFDDSRFALAKTYYYANMEDKAKEYFSASLQYRKNQFGSNSKEYNEAKKWLDKYE